MRLDVPFGIEPERIDMCSLPFVGHSGPYAEVQRGCCVSEQSIASGADGGSQAGDGVDLGAQGRIETRTVGGARKRREESKYTPHH